MIAGPNVAHAFSYADIVQGQNGQLTFGNIPPQPFPQPSQPLPQPFPCVSQPPLGVAGHDNRGVYSASGNAGAQRPRSNSKRRRNEDGSYTEVGNSQNIDHQGNQKQSTKGNPVGRQTQKPKPIIGTATGRKMRSVDDIVNDLMDSDINIEHQDVIKMSKPEAALCSYKISVRSADLSKALEPSIWPLRVKVREFIHYSKKPKQGGTEKASSNEPQARQDQSQQNNANQDTLSVPVPNLGNDIDPSNQ